MTDSSHSRLGRTLLLIGRLALAAIFIVAGYLKMKPLDGMPWTLGSINVSLSLFAVGVDSYKLLTPSAVTLVAHLLPPFEIFLGLWLLSGIALRLSSLASALLICTFIMALASAYERGLAVDCRCFGPGAQVSVKQELVQDCLVLLPLALAVTVGAFLLRRKRSGTFPVSSSAPVHQSTAHIAPTGVS